MHFLSFIFDNNLNVFRIGKLFIIRRQCYMQHLVCIVHAYRLAATTVKMELVYVYRRYNHTLVPHTICYDITIK